MADVVDDDTEQAVQTLWATDTAHLPALVKHPPRVGRLKTPEPLPYATVMSEPDHRDLASSAGVWHDYRKVTLTVWGIRADAVKALGFMADLFGLGLGRAGQPTLTYPSGARFIQWWPMDGGTLTEDETTKEGRDVWKGTLIGRVWSIRLT